ncbi:hypothetical protein [Thermoflexus hugenholtzii]
MAGAIHPALRGRSFRVGHMGEIGLPALLQTLSAIEIALRRLGHPVTPGAGVAAAQAEWTREA